MTSALKVRASTPQPGFFRLRLVKGGPWVAARIHHTCCCTVNGGYANAPHRWCQTCDRYPHMQAEIAGESADPQRVWDFGWTIAEDEYRYLSAVKDWATENAPLSPEANPRKSIDLNAMPPLF